MKIATLIQVWLLAVITLPVLYCDAKDVAVDAAGNDIDARNKVDVCVIGAGPSGIQAAYTAYNKGYSVKVLEKNSYIGGKTKLVKVDEETYPLGAVAHFYDHDTSIESLLQEFNIPTFRVPDFEWMDQDGSTLYQFPMFGRLFGTVILFVRRYFLSQYLDSPDAFTSDYPDELNMPFNKWLDKNGLSAMKPTMWRSATCHGYGDQNIVPALYPLRASSTALIAAVFVKEFLKFFFPSYDTGTIKRVHFQELLEAMADTLPVSSVILEANITNVDYDGNSDSNTILYYTTANHGETTESVSCGSTVIAFSQTLNTMKDHFIPPKAAKGLEKLLAQVHTVNYYSMLYEDKDDKYSQFKQDLIYLKKYPSIPDKPALNTLVGRYLGTPGSSVVAYYLSPSDKTNEEALHESMRHYEKLVGVQQQQLKTTNSSKTATIVQDFNYWPTYSPHVLQKDLDAGFYKKFDSLQGINNQYYVGGLFNGETVQSSMQHGEHIINRFFSSPSQQKAQNCSSTHHTTTQPCIHTDEIGDMEL